MRRVTCTAASARCAASCSAFAVRRKTGRPRTKSTRCAAIRGDKLKPAEAIRMLNSYERALKGYTYLQLNGGASNGGPK